jgi:hypothetical protein
MQCQVGIYKRRPALGDANQRDVPLSPGFSSSRSDFFSPGLSNGKDEGNQYVRYILFKLDTQEPQDSL